MARVHPSLLKSELRSITVEAGSNYPALSRRLNEINRWISEKKDGLLMSKPLVLDFLLEFIEDTKLWLKLQLLADDQRQQVLNEFTPVELHWFCYILPKWLGEKDPKLTIWKRKLMSGECNRSDSKLIDSLSNVIEDLGGAALWRYILDYSMATDLIISSKSGLPLCVQLTTSASELLIDKRDNWELTLCYWEIKRALFVSFNPVGRYRQPVKLAEFLLEKGDSLPDHCYSECSI